MKRRIVAVLLATALSLAPVQKSQALPGLGNIVFDPQNYGQNLLVAARTLAMIDNQIRSLQNEVVMLRNMARHLEGLDFSSLARLDFAINQINLMMSRAEGIAFTVMAADAEYAATYPKIYADTVTNDDLVRAARRRWEHSVDGWRHSMRVQAQVSEGVAADQEVMAALVERSQTAAGSLQVGQAANQLMALGIQQTAKTQQLMAAQYRAEAIESARQVAAEEEARARFKRFLGDGKAYTPLR